jgi:hypothetical protein
LPLSSSFRFIYSFSTYKFETLYLKC